MKKILISVVIVFFLLIVLMANYSQSVYAGTYDVSIGSGFRCGNLLMKEGLQKAQVIYNCGEPFMTEKSYVDAYGEVDKLVYGPDHGYFYVLYFFVGKLIKVEEVRQD